MRNKDKIVIKFERPESIRDVLKEASELHGDKIVYKYYVSQNTVAEMSYNRMYNVYKALGSGLLNLGLSSSKIAVLADNRPEWIISYCAIIGSGNVVIPMDKELLPSQVEAFLAYAEAEAIVVSAKYLPSVIRMDLPKLRYIIDLDNAAEQNGFEDVRCRKYSDLTAAADNPEDNHFKHLHYDRSKMSALIFTSGTTGTSKGVMLSEENILEGIYASSNMICFDSKNVLLSVLPMHHTYETTCGQLTAIRLGLTICINNSLKYFMKNVKLFRPTAMVLVPLFAVTMRKKILEELKKRKLDKIVNAGIRASHLVSKTGIRTNKLLFAFLRNSLGGRLRNIVVGGAAIDAETVEWYQSIGITVSQGYGITECSPLVAVNPLVILDSASVGVQTPDSKVKIVDTDEEGNEIDLPCGEVGEICVKGRQVMIGYYRDEAATINAFTGDGFFRTGDYGYIDKRGYIFITGRKKNIIVLQNGKNVYPEEIEEYLDKLDIIKECVVIGRQKDDGEVLLTALIYPDYDQFNGCSESEIIDRVRAEVAKINKNLPIFKQVRNIELKKSEFEKTTTQKIIRYKLS